MKPLSRHSFVYSGLPYLYAGMLIIAGYWQISFFTAAFKWDMIDVVFPFRYYFSQCIRSGIFPFWNPFQQTGSPFFADLQVPTYNPELLYTSLLGGYSIYTMHILFIGYLLVSATGMYRLSFYFNKNKNASFTAALAYVFSGYVVAHAQHFFLLVGMAWIPFVILSYIKLNQNLNLVSAIKASLFAFLMITGAYQALSITLMYLLILLFVYFVWKALAAKNRTRILRIFKFNLLFALPLLLLTLPLIVSTVEIFPSVERLASGIGLHKSLTQELPFTALFSFLVPFSTVTKTNFFHHADISLINFYFGTVMLLFFVVSWFKKHSFLEYIILFFGILIFSMSFGFLPVRKWMWEYIPLMNSFKYASYLSIFGIMGFILAAAGYFASFEKNVASERKKIMAAAAVFAAFYVFLIFYSLDKISPVSLRHLLPFNNADPFFQQATFYQSVFIQSFLDVLVIAGVFIALVFYKKMKRPVTVIMVLLAGDLLMATQMNMYTTAVDTKYTPRDLQTSINLSPKGFPVPVNDKIIFNDLLHAFFAPFWRNTYIFTKQISFTGFSSFRLNSYNKIDRYPHLKRAVLNHPLFYFSDTVIPLSKFRDKAIHDNNAQYLFVSGHDFKILSRKKVKPDPSGVIRIKKFTPNEVVISTRNRSNQFLTRLQTRFKGWTSYIDKKPVPVYTSNFNYGTLFLPKGKHIVTYRYKNNTVLGLYLFSNILFVFLALFLLGNRLSDKRDTSKKYLMVPGIILALILLLTAVNFTRKNKNITTFQYYSSFFGKKHRYLEIKKYFQKGQNAKAGSGGSTDKNQAVAGPETTFLPLAELVQKNNRIKEGTLYVTARIFSRNYPDALLVSEINHVWHASKIERQIESPNRWNHLFYVRHIPKMKEGEVLKVYIWNLHKARFIVKDVSVGFYE